ncbi:uncharacterized protein LOC125553644 [Triticum urartu]|uniref:Uncharacterized protein n=1 Tax=Triticum urartu TaxID=4572 RepID=A0A8R7Q460_TRIUA|nr:uncharacterized protein LOC125553644 [Triticum urartu]
MRSTTTAMSWSSTGDLDREESSSKTRDTTESSTTTTPSMPRRSQGPVPARRSSDGGGDRRRGQPPANSRDGGGDRRVSASPITTITRRPKWTCASAVGNGIGTEVDHRGDQRAGGGRRNRWRRYRSWVGRGGPARGGRRRACSWATSWAGSLATQDRLRQRAAGRGDARAMGAGRGDAGR